MAPFSSKITSFRRKTRHQSPSRLAHRHRNRTIFAACRKRRRLALTRTKNPQVHPLTSVKKWNHPLGNPVLPARTQLCHLPQTLHQPASLKLYFVRVTNLSACVALRMCASAHGNYPQRRSSASLSKIRPRSLTLPRSPVSIRHVVLYVIFFEVLYPSAT